MPLLPSHRAAMYLYLACPTVELSQSGACLCSSVSMLGRHIGRQDPQTTQFEQALSTCCRKALQSVRAMGKNSHVSCPVHLHNIAHVSSYWSDLIILSCISWAVTGGTPVHPTFLSAAAPSCSAPPATTATVPHPPAPSANPRPHSVPHITRLRAGQGTTP